MKAKIEKYILTWEYNCYSNGIPDEVPDEITHMVPSYKKIAIAILKNDVSLKTLGETPKKSKYYYPLKRALKTKKNYQLNFFNNE